MTYALHHLIKFQLMPLGDTAKRHKSMFCKAKSNLNKDLLIEVDEPNPRHWQYLGLAASFPT